jgi:hypothetical protein
VLYPQTFVRHKASGLIFEITPDPASDPGHKLGYSDFFAKVLPLRVKSAAPCEETVATLAKPEVCVSLKALGFVSFTGD